MIHWKRLDEMCLSERISMQRTVVTQRNLIVPFQAIEEILLTLTMIQDVVVIV